MPMTYMELAHELAAQGYTREEFASVLKELTGEDYYSADPSTYIEEDFATSLEEGTTPLQSGPPVEAGPRSVTAAPLPMMSTPEVFDLPAAMEFQRSPEGREAEFFAREPSPTEFTYPEHTPAPPLPEAPTTDWQPMRVGGRLDVGGVPAPPPEEEVPSAPYRPMTLDEYASASGRPAPISLQEYAEAADLPAAGIRAPAESLRYPEEYEHTLAVTEALGADPESIYREKDEPWETATPPGFVPTQHAPVSMESLALAGRKIKEGAAALPSAVAEVGKQIWGLGEYLPTLPDAGVPGGPLPEGAMAPSQVKKHDRLLSALGLDSPESRAETERKAAVREEFYEKAEGPPISIADFTKAALDPFDFAETVLDNRTVATWGSAMWERFIQLFEVPVEYAIEGDLRLERLLRPEQWESDEDMDYMLFTGQTQKITRNDRMAFDKLWDMQDEEVIEGIDMVAADASAQADLYGVVTNARKSVGNLANGLWEMGWSAIGGNIPMAAWKAKSPEERARILEDQADDALKRFLGKDMTAFVFAAMANPLTAAEVFPAELLFVTYRPMKWMGGKAMNKVVEGTGRILDWAGARGFAPEATLMRDIGAGINRALVDPAYAPTAKGREFLETSGREASLQARATEAVVQDIGRVISEETAAGRPPEIIEVGEMPLTAREAFIRELQFRTPEEAAELGVVRRPREALEAGVLDSIEGLSETRWPHTPERKLGFEYPNETVDVSAITGKEVRPLRETAEPTMRDPQPTILPPEALDMIRHLDDVFGEMGVVMRDIISESELAGEVIAAMDIRLANQITVPKSQAAIIETAVSRAAEAFHGGKMPKKVESAMRETVAGILETAAGRRARPGGTSKVSNPIIKLEDAASGKSITINSARTLEAEQLANSEFRAGVQKQLMDYVSRRIKAKVNAKGIQTGVANQIVESSTMVDRAAYEAAAPEARRGLLFDALRGDEGMRKHTMLRRKLEKERAKQKKERDTDKIERLSEELYEMEHGGPDTPGLVDAHLDMLIERFRADGDLPVTWNFGDALELAFDRLEARVHAKAVGDGLTAKDATKSAKRYMNRLGMLREHLRRKKKVYGVGLDAEGRLMGTYFGFTPPSEMAMTAFRRASAKPLEAITELIPDTYMPESLYKVSKLMAQDAGVLPATLAFKGLEAFWRNIKLGKVAGNPGSHIMALGSNTLVQAQRRGDLFIGQKAALVLIDYLRFKAGMKTVTDPKIFRDLELSGRISGSDIGGEIDLNLRRALENQELGKSDPWGDLMTLGVGRRVYDWWDTMFKIEDGVNQYGRRMKDWESLPGGTAERPIEYHFPISRTKTVEAQKVNGKMVVGGRVLTDRQFRQMIGRAAMEPGSRVLVDFLDVPLLAVFKRNFPLLDMMLADFSTWRMVTDTVPFMKEGIVGEIMMGPVPRGWTNDFGLWLRRTAEHTTANTARTMMAATLSQSVSGEDEQILRAMLNRYGAASPVFAISATEDPRVANVANGTSFSVYESVERWLRLAESAGMTAPEWAGYVKPDTFVEVPGKEGERPTKERMLLLSPAQMAKLSPERKRHIERSRAYWTEMATKGGMGRKATMALAYLEGNLFVNLFADLMFETRKEGQMGWGLSAADTLLRAFVPRWASAGIYLGLESKRAQDLEDYREAMSELPVEIGDPAETALLQEEHLKHAAGIGQMTRFEYMPEAVLGALDPTIAASPLRQFAQRTLHWPRAVAIFHKHNQDPEAGFKKGDIERGGIEAVGFSRKNVAMNAYIDRVTNNFMMGFYDAFRMHEEATYAGDMTVAEARKVFERKLPSVGRKLKAMRTLFRDMMRTQADEIQGRWERTFRELKLKGEQKGTRRAPSELMRYRGVTPEGFIRDVPAEGWEEPPARGPGTGYQKRKKFEEPELYYPPEYPF